MESMADEISTAPKTRASPMDFRNTDLVSRLLAATPPYLYNMPLVPNSFFFSEMLRSLVQGKAEAAARLSSSIPHRRSRKRTWAQGRADHYKQESPKNETQEMPPPNWTPKIPEKSFEKSLMDRPLELTMNKMPLNNNTKICHTETQPNDIKPCDLSPKSDVNLATTIPDKPEMHPSTSNGHIPMSFPPIPNLTPPDANSVTPDLMLPPPPPMWYPPLYPAPYAFDPLHFFIDLRVSGHIYDRKNQKDPNIMNQPQLNGFPHGPPNSVVDCNGSNLSSTITSPTLPDSIGFNSPRESLLKSRHSSAFTVPVPSMARNDPLNLSGNRYQHQKTARYSDEYKAKAESKGKFDIKSMGFDRTEENMNGANYIMKNLPKIYKEVHEKKYKQEGIDLTKDQEEEEEDTDVEVKNEEENKEESSEEKEKRCKDIRALIGLELVVDYVNHDVKPKNKDEKLSDTESIASSPPLEVTHHPGIESKM